MDSFSRRALVALAALMVATAAGAVPIGVNPDTSGIASVNAASSPPAPTIHVASMTDLGTLGGNFSTANAINDAGQVVGESTTASGESRAFLWEPAAGMIDLGVLPDINPPSGKGSAAHGINERGQVVGESLCGINCLHAFVWQPETGMVDRGRLGGGGNEARAIDDAGSIVGTATMGLSRTSGNRAFLLPTGGEFLDLGALGSGYNSGARGIDNHGRVVGFSETAHLTGHHAILWQAESGMVDLGTLPGGGQSDAYAVNDAGEVVGWSEVDFRGSGTRMGFRWRPATGMTALGTGSDWPRFEAAFGINEAGDAVGIGNPGFGFRHAFMAPAAGGFLDLGILDGGSSTAHDINDRMQAVGQARLANGETHAVLWTLTTEPVGNRSPIAFCNGASHGFAGGLEGLGVQFRGWGSWDADGDQLSYSWDFGDGTFGSGVGTTHVYADDGNYTATLTVSDGRGGEGRASCRVVVENFAPSIQGLEGATLLAGDTYTLSATFIDFGNDSWGATVDYGDGSGTQTLPLEGKTFFLSHRYDTLGTYVVTVTVNDDDGGTGIRDAAVEVVTLAQATARISSTIDELVDSGRLGHGHADSLRAKLAAAVRQLEDEHRNAAANQLRAFMEEVAALERAGVLTSEDALTLTDATERIARLL